jgi:hypothetical protein
MDNWGRSREVEKPKPIKMRAGMAATGLINLRLALDEVLGMHHQGRGREVISEAIHVLQVVAGEKKA